MTAVQLASRCRLAGVDAQALGEPDDLVDGTIDLKNGYHIQVGTAAITLVKTRGIGNRREFVFYNPPQPPNALGLAALLARYRELTK